MSSEEASRRLTRVQIAGVLLFALASAALLARAVWLDPRVPFLAGDAGGAWIADPMPLHTHGMWIERAAPRPRLFERRFRVERVDGPVTLRLRALGEVTLRWNGRVVDLGARDPRRWKETTVVDVTPWAAAGENHLLAEVRSRDGAPLLSLRIDGLGAPITTDRGWLAARQGDAFAPALVASDARRLPEAAALPRPWPSLRAHAALFAALFAAGAAGSLLGRPPPGLVARAPRLAFLLVTAFWLWLFAAKVVHIPAAVGFDAAGHVDYVRWIVERGALPTARDGFSFYHPPLFHLVAAGPLGLLGAAPGSVLERALLTLPASLAGLGMALVAGALMRRLEPGRPGLEAASVLAAGLLPMSLVLGACVSNEAPHALLASLAILVTVRALVSQRASRRDDVVLGLLLGAALLAKYTSALLAPLLVAAVAAKRLWAEPEAGARDTPPPHGPAWRRAAAGAAASLGLAAAVAGWFYLRNLLRFGDPFVWNLDVDPARTWWQLPGFHTAGWFLRFGEAFVQPWFSGFSSFWDSLYTTLWGDGLLTGAALPAAFHGRWRLDLMAAGFVLALPATALLLAGWLRVARRALRDPDLGLRLACSLLAFLPVVFGLSLVSVNLRLAQWSLAKSFYVLFLTPLLGVLLALGGEALLRARPGSRGLRAALFGWAAAFGGAVVLAFAA